MPFVGSVEAKMAFGRPTAVSSNIVTSNLQIWLDSGNNASYAGSGTTWTNLVSGNAPTYNFTLQNFAGATTSNIIYNGTTNRAINFDGTNDYTINNTSLLTLLAANSYREAREFWLYWPGTAGNLISELGQSTVNSSWHDAQASLESTTLAISPWEGPYQAYIATTSFVANQWNHVVWQHNYTTSNLSAYVNGGLVYNNGAVGRGIPTPGFFLALCQLDSTNFGYGGGSQLAASIAIFRWYNNVLTANQVFQNYKNDYARFGNIMTTNLMLYLDAANYTGSGPWTDMISNLSFTLTNGPTYSSLNGGYFTFVAASSQYAQSTTSLASMSNFTIEVWHYFTNVNTGVGAAIVTEVYNNNLNNSINYVIPGLGGTGSTITGNQVACTSFISPNWEPANASGYTLPASNAWYQIVGTYDGSNFRTYVNTTLRVTNAYSGTAPNSGGQGINLMKRWDTPSSLGNAFWGGRLAIVRMYSTALSQAQITTNYNANKARFGLA